MHDTSYSLLERVRAESEAADWRRLVALYTPFLERLVQHFDVWGAERDDLLQEVFSVVVAEIRSFEHNGQRGAFRRWLRTIALNRLRGVWRARQSSREALDDGSLLVAQADPVNALEQLWDREHDAHVARRLMEMLEPEFALTTWQAFRRQVLDGVSAAQAARELGMTVNAVLISKSRVLRRFRQEVAGLID